MKNKNNGHTKMSIRFSGKIQLDKAQAHNLVLPSLKSYRSISMKNICYTQQAFSVSTNNQINNQENFPEIQSNGFKNYNLENNNNPDNDKQQEKDLSKTMTPKMFKKNTSNKYKTPNQKVNFNFESLKLIDKKSFFETISQKMQLKNEDLTKEKTNTIRKISALEKQVFNTNDLKKISELGTCPKSKYFSDNKVTDNFHPILPSNNNINNNLSSYKCPNPKRILFTKSRMNSLNPENKPLANLHVILENSSNNQDNNDKCIRLKFNQRKGMNKKPIIIFCFEGVIGVIQKLNFWSNDKCLILRPEIYCLEEIKNYFQLILLITSESTSSDHLNLYSGLFLEYFDGIYKSIHTKTLCLCQIVFDFNCETNFDRIILISSYGIDFDFLSIYNDHCLVPEVKNISKLLSKCNQIPFIHECRLSKNLPICLLVPDIRLEKNYMAISLNNITDIMMSLYSIYEQKEETNNPCVLINQDMTPQEMLNQKPQTVIVATVNPVPPFSRVIRKYTRQFLDSKKRATNSNWDEIFKYNYAKSLIPLRFINTLEIQKSFNEYYSLKNKLSQQLIKYKEDSKIESKNNNVNSFYFLNEFNFLIQQNEVTARQIREYKRYFYKIEDEDEEDKTRNNINLLDLKEHRIMIIPQRLFSLVNSTIIFIEKSKSVLDLLKGD